MSGQLPLQINLGKSMTCLATVADTQGPDANGDPRTITPTGTITWTAVQDYGGAGHPSPPGSCSLVTLTKGVGQCPTTYTPTFLGAPPGPAYVGTQHFWATYMTDLVHAPQKSSSPVDVTVIDQHPVQVIANCQPGNVRTAPLLLSPPPAMTSSCTVTVTDSSSSPLLPFGMIAWTDASGNGGLQPGSCQLQQVGSSQTAACQAAVTYKPTAPGPPDGPDGNSTHWIVATYQSQDGLHSGNTNGQTTPLYVHP